MMIAKAQCLFLILYKRGVKHGITIHLSRTIMYSCNQYISSNAMLEQVVHTTQ